MKQLLLEWPLQLRFNSGKPRKQFFVLINSVSEVVSLRICSLYCHFCFWGSGRTISFIGGVNYFINLDLCRPGFALASTGRLVSIGGLTARTSARSVEEVDSVSLRETEPTSSPSSTLFDLSIFGCFLVPPGKLSDCSGFDAWSWRGGMSPWDEKEHESTGVGFTVHVYPPRIRTDSLYH